MIEYLNVNDPYTLMSEYPRMDQSGERFGRPAVWIEPGRLVTIDGKELIHGNFYFGSHLGRTYGESNDNGVINPSLMLGSASLSEPYNSHEPPSYRTLSPRQRRDYLEWLAGGCVSPDVPDEFSSIYFYGLEHRLMIDLNGNDPKLVAEMRRLTKVFPAVARLQRDVARIELFLGKKIAYQARPVFTREMQVAHRPPPSVLLYLGRKIARERVIDGEDAFLWAECCFRIFFPKAYHRCRPEFQALFIGTFKEAYPNGLLVTSNKALRLFHRTGTWHRKVDFVLPRDVPFVPDIEHSPHLIEQLTAIVNAVGASLEGYDRLLARRPELAQSIEAVPLLPKTLHCEPWIGRFAPVKTTIDEGLARSGFITTSVASFLAMLGMNVPKANVPAKSLGLAAALLDAFDIGFEPDRRFGFTGLHADGSICLFRAVDGGPLSEEGERYREARLLCEIAVLAAVCDGQANQREMQVVKTLFSEIEQLHEIEKRRMTAVARTLMKGNVSPTNAFSTLAKMGERLRERAISLAIEVILSDGTANAREVAFLEKMYKTLGLDAADLYNRLHRSEAEPEGLVRIETGTRQPGVPISSNDKLPVAAVEIEVEREPEVVIDLERLSRIKVETAAVSAMLSEIFKEEELPVAVTAAPIQPVSRNATSLPFEGLDLAHGTLLVKLIEGGPLDAAGFMAAVRELRLMPEGALETLNEWGFDNVGDAIINDENGAEIFPDFLVEVVAKRVET